MGGRDTLRRDGVAHGSLQLRWCWWLCVYSKGSHSEPADLLLLLLWTPVSNEIPERRR